MSTSPGSPVPAPPRRPAGRRDLAQAVSRPFLPLIGAVLVLLLLGAATTVLHLAVLGPELDTAWHDTGALRSSEEAMLDQDANIRGFLLTPAPADRQFLAAYRRGQAQHDASTRALTRTRVARSLRQALDDRERAARTWQTQWAGAAVGDAAGKPTSEPFLAQGREMFEDYRRADAAATGLLGAHTTRLLLWDERSARSGGAAGLVAVLVALVALRRARDRLLASVATPLAAVAATVRAGAEGRAPEDPATVTADIVELDGLAADVHELLASLQQRDRALRDRAHELDVLGRRQPRLVTDPDPREAICRAAAKIAGSSATFLFEPDGHGSMVDTACLGRPPGELVLPLHGETNLVAQVYLTRRGVLVDDVHTDPRVAQRAVVGIAPTGALWLPVLAEDRCLGVLAVALPQRGRDTSPAVPASLEVLAGAAAIAIDRNDLHTRIAAQARTDALTGIANRRAWDDGLDHEIARARRNCTVLAVAMLDLDHFKTYNDTHGHQAGDSLLRAAADLWTSRLRRTDLLARYGGEEFAIALPGCDLAAARELLQGLRGHLPDGQTCSVGVTVWDGTESAASVVARADLALYAAKDGGRDQVRTAEPVRVPAAG